MDAVMQADGTGPASQPKQRERERLKAIATKGLREPEALSRLEIMELCGLVLDQTTEQTEQDGSEISDRKVAVAELVRLSQHLGAE